MGKSFFANGRVALQCDRGIADAACPMSVCALRKRSLWRATLKFGENSLFDNRIRKGTLHFSHKKWLGATFPRDCQAATLPISSISFLSSSTRSRIDGRSGATFRHPGSGLKSPVLLSPKTFMEDMSSIA